ncbi:ClpXP protease specificity-enhancing factor SspB [Aliiroseovarius sp. KMU-50]|uniref:ClpXP protease specificity-enhancing factor SspB n=1 Tax=Aliiroseovarius salicola TaxID=3009082 RepID=A0ABT4W2E4_9RHOB|nr:ClpXP protease specificity-enhancing factor SspB [Aliiroseovarius sp. KMU-50]MDA5094693.1 ClpXP protease specificity-enhancing factor SspB [Aliiroseovarius sp. KMU-50]
MTGSIDYGNLMHDAMRGLIKTVLDDVAAEGLPGQHHFFINFNTRHPDAELAEWMYDRFPEDMTIVLQHWFADLEVDDDGFAVTLNFGDSPEPLYVPFDAINTFVDPSVEFGLRFETQESEEHHANLHLASEDEPDDVSEEEVAKAEPASVEEETEEKVEEPHDADVVSLDSFRK